MSGAEAQLREQICSVGRALFERGHVAGSAGNISVRLDGDAGYLITPTDACLGALDPARLARLDAQAQHLSGDRPSKTIALHRRIYGAARAFDPCTRCVIHTHGTHCVALSLQRPQGPPADRELLPALTPYFVMKVGHVPLIPYQRPGAAAAADAVAAAIERWGGAGRPIRAVMLERLGPNVWHDELAAAFAAVEELEETARLACLSAAAGPAPLSDEQIDELRTAFGARW